MERTDAERGNLPDLLPTFNLETMSGISPGTRTKRFHLLRLGVLGDAKDTSTSDGWAKLFWFDEPASAVVIHEKNNKLTQLDDVEPATILVTLDAALEPHGCQLMSCGSCRFWRMVEISLPEEVPAGECRWSANRSRETKNLLSQQTGSSNVADTLDRDMRRQSALTLSCNQWMRRSDDSQLGADSDSDAQSVEGSKCSGQSRPLNAQLQPDQPQSWLQKLWQRLGFAHRQARPSGSPRSALSLAALERSGGGAGTEPCLGCHGRMANMGALTIPTIEGDKQTYSLWRCRVCFCTYLNSWIDRWERLDTLETEETIYRVAPAEAIELLAYTQKSDAVESANGSREASQKQLWFDQLLAKRHPLTHQVRHGR